MPKELLFKVKYLFSRDRYLIVEQLEKNINFEVNDESKLEGCEIEPYLSQPRSIDKNGKIRTDLFVFHLKNKNDVLKFQIDQNVYLTVSKIL